MSVKINLSLLIKSHYKTLKNDNTGKLSFADFITFTMIPVILCGLAIYLKLGINSELRAALINFGAIFSALLMSVLVLVYDQENKLTDRNQLNKKLLEENKDTYYFLENYEGKKELLGQLYHNICFAIIVSLAIVVFSMIQILTIKLTSLNIFLLNPLIIFSLYSLVLTTLMIVKRMHALLNANK